MDDFGFDVEETSTQQAKEVEQTTGSKYEPLANKWQEARENDNAVVLSGVEKNQVSNIRNYMYRAFDKEEVIVRSKSREQDDLYNVTIRARENGEYLPDDSDEESANGEADTTEDIVDEAEQAAQEDMEEEPVMTDEDYFG
jgi:hypothetical protein